MAQANEKSPSRSYGGVSASDRIAGRRGRFLDAGLELYGTRGYVATGVKDVCRQAGLTDRYFYESFRNSEELFTAVFDRTTGELLQLVATAVAGVEPEPEQQVRAAIGSFVRGLDEDPRKSRVIFVETASAGAAVERHVRDTVRRFAGLVAETSRPHVGARVPDRVLQMGAVSLVGAIERVMIDRQDGVLDVTVDEVIDYLVELFLITGTLVGVTRRRR
jgi:AcrR family transcriptional regulator